MHTLSSRHLISIIIPTFNSARNISDCLTSIYSQTYRDFEILVMDAQSSDETRRIVENFQGKHANIHFLSERDKGTYDAMNKGIDRAGGDWLLFLGADDMLYDDDVLSDISGTLFQSSAEMVYGDVLLVGDTLFGKMNERYAGKFSREKIIRQNICHQSIFYSKRVFEKLGRYDLAYPVNADWDINQQCLARLETLYVPRIISKFSPGGQSSQKIDQFYEKDRIVRAAHHFKIGFLDKSFRGQGKPFYRISADYLSRGKYAKALFFAFVALYQSPAEVMQYVYRRSLRKKTR